MEATFASGVNTSVEIVSKSRSSDIHITLSEVLLCEPFPASLEYEALSYCWATEDGDDSRSQVIYCDEAHILITKNCEAALRRPRRDTVVLWIDTMCINQSDDKERSSQVNRIELIYAYVSSVKIYPGELLDDTDTDSNEQISETTATFLAALYNALKDSDLPEKDTESKCLLYQGPGLKGLRDILSRRWWHRVWVVQEAYLARECATLWGKDSFLLLTSLFSTQSPNGLDGTSCLKSSVFTKLTSMCSIPLGPS